MLALAIIAQAFEDARLAPRGGPACGLAEDEDAVSETDAQLWLVADSVRWIESPDFDVVCRAAGVRPSAARGALRKEGLL